jgi:putative ABC transport system substrate-binding protein
LLFGVLSLAFFAWTPAVIAQERQTIPRVGIIGATTAALSREHVDAFRAELRKLGYVDHQNVVVEERWAEGKSERFGPLLAELQQLKVDVIVVASATGARLAKQVTSTTPVVFVAVTDPVGSGIVASLARPGGNLTGTSLLIGEELAGKWVELAKEALPRISSLAALGDSTHPVTGAYVRGMEAAARNLRLSLMISEVYRSADVEEVLSSLPKTSGALIVTASPLFGAQRARIAESALARGIPTIGYDREFVAAGGLMSYGPSFADAYRRGAVYVDRILRGAKPGDLPVEQSTRFELVINLRTAKALGLVIPPTLRLRADHLVQ